MCQALDIAKGNSFHEGKGISAMTEKTRLLLRNAQTHKGGSGHLTVRRGDRTSQLPMHGSRRELGTKLIAKIKKDLDL